MNDFNDQVIAEFRANRGHVTTAGFADGLVLVHSFGTKTGQERVHPVAAIAEDADHWLIAASAAGAPEHPQWYRNLMGRPQTTIEVGTGDVQVTAEDIADDDAYAAAWARFTAMSPGFAAYEEKAAPRRIRSYASAAAEHPTLSRAAPVHRWRPDPVRSQNVYGTWTQVRTSAPRG